MIKNVFFLNLIFLYHNHKSYHNTKPHKQKNTFIYGFLKIGFKNLYLLEIAMKQIFTCKINEKHKQHLN